MLKAPTKPLTGSISKYAPSVERFANAILGNSDDAADKDLKKIQETGYFGDLLVYMKEDGKAYRPGETDSFHPVN